MNLNIMITKLREFSTLLKNASEENQAAFFHAFFAAYSSLQNPQDQDQAQAQAQAVTALNTQVSEIGVNNYQVINTTEALLNLANLLNQNTINLIALGDVGALACASSSTPTGRQDLYELLKKCLPNPQQQGLQSFTTIIDHLIENQVVMQDGVITAGEVVNSALALAPTPAPAQYSCAAAAAEPAPAQDSCAAAAAEPAPAQDSCAAAAVEPTVEPTTPRKNNKARSLNTPPPLALSQSPSVELPHLPPAMQSALAQLLRLQLQQQFEQSSPFGAWQLDRKEKKDNGR